MTTPQQETKPTVAPDAPLNVSLREITADTVIQVVGLKVNPKQEQFVASNAVSLAQALFEPNAWYRAIYVDDVVAGFVMLADDSILPDPPDQPEIGIWRFMVDARYQGTGVGAQALAQVIDHVRSKRTFTTLLLSYVPGEGSPERFYLRAGFRHTGRLDDGEVVLELPLASEEGQCEPA